MTFFEKELHRLFDDSECISEDAVFAGKTMIAPIGEDLRAKVQFVYTNTHAKYDALRLTIINRHEGTVDSETFKFKDILGMKGDREPHIWEKYYVILDLLSRHLLDFRLTKPFYIFQSGSSCSQHQYRPCQLL